MFHFVSEILSLGVPIADIVILLQQACVMQMVPNKRYGEEAVTSVLPSDKYLDCPETPAPPAISDYRNILTTPPPAPEVTIIPTEILQVRELHSSATRAATLHFC